MKILCSIQLSLILFLKVLKNIIKTDGLLNENNEVLNIFCLKDSYTEKQKNVKNVNLYFCYTLKFEKSYKSS